MTTTDMNRYPNYLCALRMIDTLTTPHTDCPSLRDDHAHDHFSSALRDLLIDRNYTPTHNDSPLDDAPDYAYATMRALLRTIDAYPYSRDDLTKLLLDNSLCPLHAIDFAICFDDDDTECAAIRTIYPYSHDT